MKNSKKLLKEIAEELGYLNEQGAGTVSGGVCNGNPIVPLSTFNPYENQSPLDILQYIVDNFGATTNLSDVSFEMTQSVYSGGGIVSYSTYNFTFDNQNISSYQDLANIFAAAGATYTTDVVAMYQEYNQLTNQTNVFTNSWDYCVGMDEPPNPVPQEYVVCCNPNATNYGQNAQGNSPYANNMQSFQNMIASDMANDYCDETLCQMPVDPGPTVGFEPAVGTGTSGTGVAPGMKPTDTLVKTLQKRANIKPKR